MKLLKAIEIMLFDEDSNILNIQNVFKFVFDVLIIVNNSENYG